MLIGVKVAGTPHSQKLGALFEDKIQTVNDEYRWKMMGTFWRNETTSRVVYTPRGPKTIQIKSQPDFSGVLSTGRFVHFDAKSIKTHQSWTLPKNKQHQYDKLLEVSRFNALCFFILESRPTELCYIVLVHPDLEEFYPLGRPSVKLKNDPDKLWVIPFLPAGGKVDWLSAIRAHYLQTSFTLALPAMG